MSVIFARQSCVCHVPFSVMRSHVLGQRICYVSVAIYLLDPNPPLTYRLLNVEVCGQQESKAEIALRPCSMRYSPTEFSYTVKLIPYAMAVRVCRSVRAR